MFGFFFEISENGQKLWSCVAFFVRERDGFRARFPAKRGYLNSEGLDVIRKYRKR